MADERRVETYHLVEEVPPELSPHTGKPKSRKRPTYLVKLQVVEVGGPTQPSGTTQPQLYASMPMHHMPNEAELQAILAKLVRAMYRGSQ